MGKDDDEDDIVSSGSETESESEEDEDTGLTENQNRLLYMISLYSHKATPGTDEKDEWVRKPALIVLLYEGIVAGVLDFDYAPASNFIENRRVWMNVSQEGKSDVEFLREEELVNGLQMSSKSFQPITCYQISEKGKELVKRISRKEKEAVHEFVYARGTRELLSAVWDGMKYNLQTANGAYSRVSSITETEDVSYVSSAYIPQCLRYGGRPTLSNAHRAHESGVSADNIRDELDEVITLNSVSIIVAEYVPFGANQIVQLNNNVGSTERCQGGFISPAVDDHAADTQVEMSPELTSVDILDYTLTNHINFEAEINFQEESGVVQVETFGVSLNAEGTCFYGLQVEAVMDRIKDNISLDHLSRLLVDVQQDSSEIVDSIISQYQRELMQLVFLGDAKSRNKVNLIIANEITPHLTAEEYMDKGEYENELKQVIGDTKAAYDISEHDTLIFGAFGLLVAGPNSRHHEPLLCAYLQFITIDIFLQNFFARLWILNDDMQTTNTIIGEGEKDPKALARIRYRICKLARDVIQMEEILSYLLEALEIIEIPPEPPEQAGRSLYERLEISGMRNQLVRRAMDLKKNIGGSHKNLDVLREMSSAVAEAKMFYLNQAVDQNTKRLCGLASHNERAAGSLGILQAMFAAFLAFQFMDRLTGPDWSVAQSEWFKNFHTDFIQNSPMLWFFLNLLIAGIFYVVVLYFAYTQIFIAEGRTTVRILMNRKIVLEKLQDFLRTKVHTFDDRQYDTMNDIVKITYKEKSKADWGDCRPYITLEFDERNEFILSVTIQYNRNQGKKALAFTAEELKEKIVDDLNSMDVWDTVAEDKSHEDLAADKRQAIQKLLDEEEEEDDD